VRASSPLCVCACAPESRFIARRGMSEAERVLPLLSLTQLRLLVQRVPSLAVRAAYVKATVAALKPPESLAVNPKPRDAYLAALDELLAPLPPAYNNIRLCILYNKVHAWVWGWVAGGVTRFHRSRSHTDTIAHAPPPVTNPTLPCPPASETPVSFSLLLTPFHPPQRCTTC
jgi:hypothetical protein